MKITNKRICWLALGSILFLLVGCSGSPAEPNPDPQIGETNFVSADAVDGQLSQDNRAPTDSESEDGGFGTPDESAGANAEERTVEEGDIYRVLGGNLILNLNAYRGLQVIDFSDPTQPEIIGRLRVSGSPVEMYVADNRVYVLLNSWYGYYGSRSDIQVDSYHGGVVLAIDIADPHKPQLTDRAQVPGWIQTSRMTRGNGKDALFVAASDWTDSASTVVRSFALRADGSLLQQSTIDLGGYVRDIQATPAALLVARYDWERTDDGSTLAIIDISDPDGVMVEGAEIVVSGMVNHKSNMNLYQGVLRVVSGSSWSGTQTNHLETFDVTDIQNPVAIDHDTFGEGESLFATLFLANKAFFVTYERVDPFHAFWIDDQGQASEKAEYVISGWNSFFRPVFAETRLLGIGVNDEGGNTMAVSLYDITDISNPDPFIARAEVSADSSWSEAQWEDKAFSILEDAVSLTNDDGIVETGLVLLPFSGYSNEAETYTAAVQIFTFSDQSLTRRGVMDHGTWVRRSFQAGDSTTANLSDAELSLFDNSNPNQPLELGRAELAPNYSQFFVYGEYGARIKYDQDNYWWWGGGSDVPDNELQIIDLAEDPDMAPALATVPIPARGQVYQVGSLAVTAEMQYIDSGNGEYKYETTIRVHDLSDPTQPQARGELVTDQIAPYYNYGYDYGIGVPERGMVDDCLGCGGYYYGGTTAHTVGQNLVFPTTVQEQELLGIEHVCYTNPAQQYYDQGCFESGSDETDTDKIDCEYYSGSITCRSLNGAPETCSGSIQLCGYTADDEWFCEEIDPDSIETETYCYDNESYRYWSHFELQVLDLSKPQTPVMAPVIVMPTREEGVSVLADGSDVYVSYRIPVKVAADSRPYVRYFIKKIDLRQALNPVIGPAINVPGSLVQVDGNTIYTQDYVWGEEVVESAINKLVVQGSQAVLKARKRFLDQEVHAMLLDGKGHALVTHRMAWYMIDRTPGMDWNDSKETLTILNTEGDKFEQLSTFEVDQWAQLQDARAGRALFSISGGLLVVNTEDASQPYAQAFFPVMGWPQSLLVHDGQISFAAGRYGMYRFGLDTFNLISD